jgi:dipeptidyl aminopeptidase/acylaminoacyl peptidase
LAPVRVGRRNITAAVVAVTVVGVMGMGAPAVSAGRNRDGFRDPDRKRDRPAERSNDARQADSGRRNRDGFRDRDRNRERAAGRSYDARQSDNNQSPVQFVAELDGRIVVVSAETGRIERFLTSQKPGSGASVPAVSPDGRTVWFSRVDGRCAAHLASVPIAGGHEEELPGSGEAGAETLPLPRPGRPQLAYARSQCDKPGSALIVGDLAGVEGRGQSGLVPLAWNRSGDLLLAMAARGSGRRLLEVDQSGAILSNHPLEPNDTTPGCRLEVVGFSPDDNNGYIAFRRCGPSDERGRRSLVLLNKDGTLRKTVLRLSRSQNFADRPAFDPTGHSLLFATVPAEMDERAATQGPVVSLWLWRDGEARPLDRETTYRHPAWLR